MELCLPCIAHAQCTFQIARLDRCCRQTAVPGSTLCPDHQPAALEASREADHARRQLAAGALDAADSERGSIDMQRASERLASSLLAPPDHHLPLIERVCALLLRGGKSHPPILPTCRTAFLFHSPPQVYSQFDEQA